MSVESQRSPQTITGRQTTGGVAEETINLELNGAAAAAAIAVAAGQILNISDFIVTNAGANIVNYRLQQANDGATFFDLALLTIDGAGTLRAPLTTPIQVRGTDGATVVIRLRAETLTALAAVTATIRADRQN